MGFLIHKHVTSILSAAVLVWGLVVTGILLATYFGVQNSVARSKARYSRILATDSHTQSDATTSKEDQLRSLYR